MKNTKLEKQLETYIKSLENDVQRLRNERGYNKVKDLINKSDANLIEEIKEELEKILGGN